MSNDADEWTTGDGRVLRPQTPAKPSAEWKKGFEAGVRARRHGVHTCGPSPRHGTRGRVRSVRKGGRQVRRRICRGETRDAIERVTTGGRRGSKHVPSFPQHKGDDAMKMMPLARGLDSIPVDRRAAFVARFRSRVALLRADERTGCLNWTGSKRQRGYGEIDLEIEGRRMRFSAHRIAYELALGPIASDLTIDHTCRNPSCVNTDHHEVVTRAENTVRQMAAIHGSDPGQRCGNNHVGEYRRDPRSNKLYCRGCHRDRWRSLHGKGIAYRGGR